MIEQLTLYKSKYSSTAKLFFPESILIKMRWDGNIPLKIKLITNGFGIQIHKQMLNDKESIHFINKYYYTAPYLIMPKSFNIIRTLPIICGYIINWQTYPVVLSIVFPSHLKNILNNIKMTNSPGKVITLPQTN